MLNGTENVNRKECNMDYKDEIIKIYDECLAELLDGEELSEDEKLDFDIARESMIAGIIKENASLEDQQFILNNLPLYKRFFKALFNEDAKEMKVIGLEMLKAKNATKS